MEIKFIAIDKIDPDHKNPRIQNDLRNLLEDPSQATREQIFDALSARRDGEDGPTYAALRDSIKGTKGIVTPIMVKKATGDRYLCVEGNTRLCVYEALVEQGEEDFKKIEAKIFEGELEKEEEHLIRLSAHFISARSWTPHAKAEYTKSLVDQGELSWERITEITGGTESELKRQVKAYQNFEKYFRPIIDETVLISPEKKFSHFVEFEKGSIQEAMGANNLGTQDFAKWVRDENIKGGADVRSLESVLNNDDAKGKFLNLVNKGGDASISALKTVAMEMVVDSPDVPLKEADLSALSLELNKKLGSLKHEQVQRWKNGIDMDSYYELLSIRDFMSSYEEEVDSNK